MKCFPKHAVLSRAVSLSFPLPDADGVKADNRVRVYESLEARSQNRKKRPLASPYLSCCPSVRPSAWTNLAPSERIFMAFDI